MPMLLIFLYSRIPHITYNNVLRAMRFASVILYKLSARPVPNQKIRIVISLFSGHKNICTCRFARFNSFFSHSFHVSVFKISIPGDVTTSPMV
jgi:hypothetical protein